MNKKITIEFNIENGDTEQEVIDSLTAWRLRAALYDIRNQIFRPSRKHGYNDNSRINQILDKIAQAAGPDSDNTGENLIYELEQVFGKILEEHNIGDV